MRNRESLQDLLFRKLKGKHITPQLVTYEKVEEQEKVEEAMSNAIRQEIDDFVKKTKVNEHALQVFDHQIEHFLNS